MAMQTGYINYQVSPDIKLDRIASFLRLWYATFSMLACVQLRMIVCGERWFHFLSWNVFWWLVWALLMCCDYWDQRRHDSWASASMFTQVPPPVKSLLAARGESLATGVVFIWKNVTCQDPVWLVTLG